MNATKMITWAYAFLISVSLLMLGIGLSACNKKEEIKQQEKLDDVEKKLADVEKHLAEVSSTLEKSNEKKAIPNEKLSTNVVATKKLSEPYLIGTHWAYSEKGVNYVMVFGRRTIDLFKVDSRGRRIKQRQKEWKLDSINRRITSSRGSESFYLNENLTEMRIGRNIAKLIKK